MMPNHDPSFPATIPSALYVGDPVVAEEVRRYQLNRKASDQLTDAELVEVLAQRYAAEPVPPCHVCGRPLSLSGTNVGGALVYACSGQEDDPDRPGVTRMRAGRQFADVHFNRSRWTQHRPGDAQVRELVQRFQGLAAFGTGARYFNFAEAPAIAINPGPHAV